MVGKLVRRRREARGWTQTDLALETGLRQVYISQVESGAIKMPRDHNLAALGKALGISKRQFYAEAGMLDELPAEVVPPTVPVEEPTGDRAWDAAALVRWVLQHPDKTFVARLERLAERVPPEAFERIALKLARAQLTNGELALAVAEEFIDLGH